MSRGWPLFQAPRNVQPWADTPRPTHVLAADGLFSQTDAAAHASMRETLNPAFRMDYLTGLVPSMAGSAQQLAGLMQAKAQASGSGSNAAGTCL